MTGEITLTGQVLQIGGVRDKVLAAQRAGISRIVLPHDNEPDLAELPPEAREQIQFILVETIEDVLAAAFENVKPLRAGAVPPAERAAASS
jgi:ATP-dependent Lon protease